MREKLTNMEKEMREAVLDILLLDIENICKSPNISLMYKYSDYSLENCTGILKNMIHYLYYFLSIGTRYVSM